MRDYLDELLDAMEEPEEEGEVPEVGQLLHVTRGLDARGGVEQREAPADEAGLWRTAVAGGVGVRGGWGALAAGRRDVTENQTRQSRSGGPGDLLSRELERAERPDVAGGMDETAATSGGDMQRTALERGSVLEQVFRGRTETGGSAAVLERRLAAGLERQGAAARVISEPAAVEKADGLLELEELDRRVERDARRYDGGLFLY